jgi:hypothetical protein
MTVAICFKKTHIVVVGKFFGVGGSSQSLVVMSVSMQDGGGGMESSGVALPEDARGVSAVYTPSIWTSVVATDSGKFFHSNDMTGTWNSALVSWLVQKDTQWLVMGGRSSLDEASAAHRHAMQNL